MYVSVVSATTIVIHYTSEVCARRAYVPHHGRALFHVGCDF
jgi:hypothetical protein